MKRGIDAEEGRTSMGKWRQRGNCVISVAGCVRVCVPASSGIARGLTAGSEYKQG